MEQVSSNHVGGYLTISRNPGRSPMSTHDITQKIIAQAEYNLTLLHGKKIVLVILNDTLKNAFDDKMNFVLKAVTKATGIDPLSLPKRSGSRYRLLVRHLAVWYMAEHYKIGRVHIAHFLGLNHSSVYNTIKRVSGYIEVKDYLTMKLVHQINKELGL